MALNEEPEEAAGIPEWVVTFGDMMSLLLTFFIMLVSLSEVKQQEKYQAMVDSIRKRFGYDEAAVNLVPGQVRARNSVFTKLATMGRSKRFDLHKGGDKVKAPVGDYPRVRIVRPGSRTAVGTVVHFAQGSVELGPQQRAALATQAEEMRGKPQKIEIRGHTSMRPPGPGSPFKDHWHLAYERCRVTMEYLRKLGIEEERMRLAVAGKNEPLNLGTAPEQLRLNPRVEVHVLDEVVADLEGTPRQNKAGNRPQPEGQGSQNR